MRQLVVGLGNPGPTYHHNRHNVGFLGLDFLRNVYAAPLFSLKNGAEVSEVRHNSHQLILIKPQKFMNASGPVVASFANFYKIQPQDVFIFHDELDVPFGRVKVKVGGGAGGHNGLRSIDAHFANETTRVRIGISHPGHKDRVHGHVLGNFSQEEQKNLPLIFDVLADELHLLLDHKLDLFRSKVATALSNLQT